MQHRFYYFHLFSWRGLKEPSLPEDQTALVNFVHVEPHIRQCFVHETSTIPLYKQRTDEARQPSLGLFKRLPIELRDIVLSDLDILSLCQLMMASSGTHAMVTGFPPFHDLVKHASPVLITLGKMRLAKVHTISAVLAVLTSPHCVACGQMGPFICLPTCERACLDCLNRNIRFSVLTYPQARVIYRLSAKQAATLPTMWTVETPMRDQPVGRVRMVNERHAAQLALALYGADGDPHRKGRVWSKVAAGNELLEWLHDDNGEPVPRTAGVPKPQTWGLGFMRMSYREVGAPVDAPVEHMCWCEGCKGHMYEMGYQAGDLYVPDSTVYWNYAELASKGGTREVELRQRKSFQAWPLAELLQHIPNCPGMPWVRQQRHLE
ncbi:hypothetical protein ACHAQA_007876 [Verticillium albo-atrum]